MSSRIHLRSPICRTIPFSLCHFVPIVALPCVNALMDIAVQSSALHTMAEQSHSLGVAPSQVAGSTTNLDCYAIHIEARTDTPSEAGERFATTKPILEDHSSRTEFPSAVTISSSRIGSLPGLTKVFHCSILPHQAQSAEHHADLSGSSYRDNLCQYHSKIIEVLSAVDISSSRISSLPALSKVFNSSIVPRLSRSAEYHISLVRSSGQDNKPHQSG
jgi:hypothetical protein